MDNTEAGPKGGNIILQNVGAVKSITGGTFTAIGDVVAPSFPTDARFGISNSSGGVIGEIGGTTTVSMEGTQRSIVLEFQSTSTQEIRITGGTFEITGYSDDSTFDCYVYLELDS